MKKYIILILSLTMVIILIWCSGCKDALSNRPNFIGKWIEETNSNNPNSIEITKKGENYIISERKGDFGDGIEGIYTLTKESGLIGQNGNVTIIYDKSSSKLLISAWGKDLTNWIASSDLGANDRMGSEVAGSQVLKTESQLEKPSLGNFYLKDAEVFSTVDSIIFSDSRLNKRFNLLIGDKVSKIFKDAKSGYGLKGIEINNEHFFAYYHTCPRFCGSYGVVFGDMKNDKLFAGTVKTGISTVWYSEYSGDQIPQKVNDWIVGIENGSVN